MPRLRVGLTFSGALTSLCPSNLAHLLSIGPKQRTFVTAAINCLWIQFFCCSSCRCCLSDPFTSRFFLPYHDKCCHAKLKKHNGMPCDQKPYMTQRSRKGKAPLKHNAFGGAFSEPLRKRSHPSVQDESPNTAHLPKQAPANPKISNVCRTQPPTKFNMVAKSFP